MSKETTISGFAHRSRKHHPRLEDMLMAKKPLRWCTIHAATALQYYKKEISRSLIPLFQITINTVTSSTHLLRYRIQNALDELGMKLDYSHGDKEDYCFPH